MRTTLDIDDDVLAAAKELAKARKTTAGEVLSELARKALTQPTQPHGPKGPAGTVLRNGWYVLPSRGGPPVTSELVQRLLDEADFEDAGLGPNCESKGE
jgi:hypothetical protein